MKHKIDFGEFSCDIWYDENKNCFSTNFLMKLYPLVKNKIEYKDFLEFWKEFFQEIERLSNENSHFR